MHTQPTLRTSSFKQVDVFTSEPMRGNPLAVVFDAEGLSSGQMQHIASWTNLSETTFVLPPTQAGADYRVRIFTPRSELPFAGHPSVGTAHALLEAERIKPKLALVQECAAGLLPVRVSGSGATRRILVRTPRARFAELAAATHAPIAQAFGAPLRAAPRIVTIGPDWVICDLGDERSVRGLQPDMQALVALRHSVNSAYFAVFGRSSGADHAITVRAFCPADGIPEDPVTGSANASIGAYLHASGELAQIGADYRASQGRELGRNGFVDVHVDAASGDVDIGGQTVTCVDGTLVMPH